jgi:hypothetical protein
MIRKECEDHNAEVKLQEQNEKSLEEQSGYVPISRGVEHDLRERSNCWTGFYGIFPE